jgi:hypothetical protein
VLYVSVMGATSKDVASVTWSGVAMTQLTDFASGVSNVGRVAIYYAINPAGTNHIVVTMASGTGGNFGAVAVNLIGASTSSPFGTPVSASIGGGGATSITSASMPGNFFIDAVIQFSAAANPSVASGQTPRDGRGNGDADGTINANESDWGVSTKAVAGPTTMRWTSGITSSFWAQVAVPVNAAPATAAADVVTMAAGIRAPDSNAIPNVFTNTVPTHSATPTPTTTPGASRQTRSPTPPPATPWVNRLPNAGGPLSDGSLNSALIALSFFLMACGFASWKFSRYLR